MGPDWRSKYVAVGCACVHVAIASWASTTRSSCLYVLILYLFGASLAQAGFLAIHELSHNLFFTRAESNRVFSMLINLPLVVPFAIAFREYHRLHHAHQGDPLLDLDLPSATEAHIFRGRLGKLCWLTLQIAFYAIRPCLRHPIALSPMLLINAVLQISFNAIVAALLGWGVLRFLLLSVVLAGGLHPCAGHFLSEHFLFDPSHGPTEQDTFCYYGPLNLLTWNVGHHVEHHDLPTVPGSRLPRVREIAPSFYAGLETCPSWSGAIVAFVVQDHMSLERRHITTPEKTS